MPNFIHIGNRVLNLDLVCGAQREGRGKVTVFFAAPGEGGQLRWEFERQSEADTLWIKLAPSGGELSEVEGGPYSITDNETTASRRRRK